MRGREAPVLSQSDVVDGICTVREEELGLIALLLYCYCLFAERRTNFLFAIESRKSLFLRRHLDLNFQGQQFEILSRK